MWQWGCKFLGPVSSSFRLGILGCVSIGVWCCRNHPRRDPRVLKGVRTSSALPVWHFNCALCRWQSQRRDETRSRQERTLYGFLAFFSIRLVPYPNLHYIMLVDGFFCLTFSYTVVGPIMGDVSFLVRARARTYGSIGLWVGSGASPHILVWVFFCIFLTCHCNRIGMLP